MPEWGLVLIGVIAGAILSLGTQLVIFLFTDRKEKHLRRKEAIRLHTKASILHMLSMTSITGNEEQEQEIINEAYKNVNDYIREVSNISDEATYGYLGIADASLEVSQERYKKILSAVDKLSYQESNTASS